MFNDLSNNAKLAYAISTTFKNILNSINNNEDVLSSASDNFTIMQYVESVNKDLYNVIENELTDNEYDIFIETIFALYNTFDLYKANTVKNSLTH